MILIDTDHSTFLKYPHSERVPGLRVENWHGPGGSACGSDPGHPEASHYQIKVTLPAS
jgi:hypothetical protein